MCTKMASSSAFQQEAADGAEQSTGSSMEWLSPDNAASYEYGTMQSLLPYVQRSKPGGQGSTSGTERSIATQAGASGARPVTPTSAGSISSTRKTHSPMPSARDGASLPFSNRSVETLSHAKDAHAGTAQQSIRAKRASASSSKMPFFLRSSSLGIEDDGGSLHWNPDGDKPPMSLSPPQSPGMQAGTVTSRPPRPPHARSSTASREDGDTNASIDPRRQGGQSSNSSTPSEGASTSPANTTVSQGAKPSTRRPGSVFEHVGGMLDRFGKRLQSRSETREAAKRNMSLASLHNGSSEANELVFVEDLSPGAIAGPSRPFSPKTLETAPASRNSPSSTYMDAAHAYSVEQVEQRASPGLHPAAPNFSPFAMTRDLSSGSMHGTRGESSSATSPVTRKHASAIDTESPASDGKDRRLERTLIQVTEDNERFSVVDISGLSSSAAIKERMMSKLHLFDDDPSCFGLIRTEIGASGPTGPALSDDEMFTMCFQQGDERGTLKFLMQQVRLPARPSRAAVPPPPIHPTSPRIALRNMYEASSATNPSTPTTNSRPPRSKSGSLSSHSSMGEIAANIDSPSMTGQQTDNTSESSAGRSLSALTRTKATNRRSMAMLSIHDDSAKTQAEAQRVPSRIDRKRELSRPIEEGKADGGVPADRRDSDRSSHSSTDAYVHDQRSNDAREHGAYDMSSAHRAPQGESGRPRTQRTTSHPPPNETATSPSLATSPMSSNLPRSLLPGGRREPRAAEYPDASSAYLASSGNEASNHPSRYGNLSGPSASSQQGQPRQNVRNVISTGDIRRRSNLQNFPEALMPQGERFKEQGLLCPERVPSSRLPSGGPPGPRAIRNNDAPFSPDGWLGSADERRYSNYSAEQERQSNGSGSFMTTDPRYRPSSKGSNVDGWYESKYAAQGQQPYAQPVYTSSVSATSARMRPGSGINDGRSPNTPTYRPGSITPMTHSARQMSPSPHLGEFGMTGRAPAGNYTVPRQNDSRMMQYQVHPQSLQDRSRYRPLATSSHGPPLQQAYGSLRATGENAYMQGHYPASSPHVVSNFQRFGAQGGLAPGKTVQEVYQQSIPHIGSPPLASNSTAQHVTRARAKTSQLPLQHSGYGPNGPHYQGPPPLQHQRSDVSHASDRNQTQVPYQANSQRQVQQALPSHGEYVQGQLSRTTSSDLPASVKYYYNPSVPQISHPAQHSQQASTSGRVSGHGQSASHQRPHTSSDEVGASSRGGGSSGEERSSASSFASFGAQSHRRVASTEGSVRPQGSGNDSAPTSAQSAHDSPRSPRKDVGYLSASGHTRKLSNNEIVDDNELVNIRLLPTVPDEQHGQSKRVRSASVEAKRSSHGDGEDTLKAGQYAQNFLERISLYDGEDGGTARAKSKAKDTEGLLGPSMSKEAQWQPSHPSQASAGHTGNAAIDEGTGTFANFDEDDDDDYDAQGGTWAQHLDSQHSNSAHTQEHGSDAQSKDGDHEAAGASHSGSSRLLPPATTSGASSASAMSPRRPVLTLNTGAASPRTLAPGFPNATQKDAQKAVAQTLLARSSSDAAQQNSASTGQSSITRSTSFAKSERADWAFRPPPELLYDNLDEYFPKHDLDKPVFENIGNAGPNSPQGASPRVEAQPMSAKSTGSTSATSPSAPAPGLTRSKLAPKKSIRLVAQDRKRFLERAEAAEQRRQASVTDLGRRRSTKLWGGRVVEMTPGVEPPPSSVDSPSSTSSEARPVFKWVKGDLIGKGTYGRVYLALNATTGEMIAVKQVELPSTASDREDARQKGVVSALKSEIETLKDLDHPNIVSYLGFEETTRNLSIFLEYVPGGSVGSCMRKHGKLDEATIKSFLHQILEGLSYLHGRGILHRDLKADNLLVDYDGIVKISDFGTVRKSEDIYGNVQSMSMQGSIFWMAPEVVSLSRAGYSAKVDIWSLGCVVLEMFAGRRPWSDEEAVQAMFKIGAERRAPPIPPDVRLSKAAAHFLKKCFAVDPTERPTASRLLHHVFPHAEEGWQFNTSSLYRQLNR